MKHIVIVCPKDKIIDKGIARTRALINNDWFDVAMDTSDWLSKKFWHIDTGEDIYNWDIEKLELTYEFDGTLELGEWTCLETPITVRSTEELLAPGEYLVKYVCDWDMTMKIGILKKFNKRTGSLAGSFLFDVPDYLIIGYVKLSWV